MRLTINGEAENIEAGEVTVAGLLALKQVESPDMVSVQLNGRVLDRGSYAKELLKDGDEVEFLYFMGGGAGR